MGATSGGWVIAAGLFRGLARSQCKSRLGVVPGPAIRKAKTCSLRCSTGAAAVKEVLPRESAPRAHKMDSLHFLPLAELFSHSINACRLAYFGPLPVLLAHRPT